MCTPDFLVSSPDAFWRGHPLMRDALLTLQHFFFSIMQYWEMVLFSSPESTKQNYQMNPCLIVTESPWRGTSPNGIITGVVCVQKPSRFDSVGHLKSEDPPKFTNTTSRAWFDLVWFLYGNCLHVRLVWGHVPSGSLIIIEACRCSTSSVETGIVHRNLSRLRACPGP